MESFDTEGFFVVREFLTHEETLELLRILNEIQKNEHWRSKGPLTTKGKESMEFQKQMLQWFQVHTRAGRPRNFDHMIHTIGNRAASLWTRNLYLLQEVFLKKPLGSLEFPGHQDFPFWPVDRPEGFVLWIGLDSCLPHTGSLQLGKSSHRLGWSPIVDLSNGRFVEDALSSTPRSPLRKIQPASFPHRGELMEGALRADGDGLHGKGRESEHRSSESDSRAGPFVLLSTLFRNIFRFRTASVDYEPCIEATTPHAPDPYLVARIAESLAPPASVRRRAQPLPFGDNKYPFQRHFLTAGSWGSEDRPPGGTPISFAPHAPAR